MEKYELRCDEINCNNGAKYGIRNNSKYFILLCDEHYKKESK